MVARRIDFSGSVTRMSSSFLGERVSFEKVSESEAKEAASLFGSREKAKLNREEAIRNRPRAILDRQQAISNRPPYFLNRETAAMLRHLLAMNPQQNIFNRQLLAQD